MNMDLRDVGGELSLMLTFHSTGDRILDYCRPGISEVHETNVLAS